MNINTVWNHVYSFKYKYKYSFKMCPHIIFVQNLWIFFAGELPQATDTVLKKTQDFKIDISAEFDIDFSTQPVTFSLLTFMRKSES